MANETVSCLVCGLATGVDVYILFTSSPILHIPVRLSFETMSYQGFVAAVVISNSRNKNRSYSRKRAG